MQGPISSMPKSTYDSLAPLNLPSKPIIYVNEPNEQTEKTDSDSRLDEKAKLESILLTQMKPGAEVPGQPRFSAPSIRSSGNQNANTGWPRMPMMMTQQAPMPLPANYRCVICKKPGHHKNLCPEAVSLYFKFSLYKNYYNRIIKFLS